MTAQRIAQISPIRRPEPVDEARHLRRAQEISQVGSWYFELTGEAISLGSCTVSDALLELYGLDPDSDPSIRERYIFAEDHLELLAAIEQLRLTGEPMAFRYRVIRASDGEQRWFDSRGVVERDRFGCIVGLTGTVADVTDLVNAEMDARAAHAELSQAVSHQQAVIAATPDAIHIYDVATRTVTRANPRGKPLIGFGAESVDVISGLGLHRHVPVRDLLQLEQTLADAQLLADREVAHLRHRVRQLDGSIHWLSRRMTPFARDEDGLVSELLLVSRDVTDVVEMEDRLKHAALHDELTGLPNRRLIRDRIEHGLRRAARGGHLAVLVCDLDGFKRINDYSGHGVGDAVLVQAAARLTEATRSGDTVARLDGDEFAIVLDIPQSQDPQELAEEVAGRISRSLAEPIFIDDAEYAVTASIGICLASDDCTAETMLSDANAAVSYVKAHGANGYAIFHASHRPDTAGREDVERRIRRALADDTVEVHYQPIVDPRTGMLHGVEALLRISNGDDGKFLDTAKVIEVAEHSGLVIDLDQRVLDIACAQAALWRRHPEHAHLTLKLNRSVKDITKPGFYDRIAAALASSGLEPAALTLEITETVLLDASEENLADLRLLNALGVGLAIDDFGTGYASLRYLAELPITCIKVDRSFTSRLPHDRTSMTLVRATVGLAEQLDINCIIEGVETINQLDALAEYESLLIQGYIYAKPQSATQPLLHHILPAGREIAGVVANPN